MSVLADHQIEKLKIIPMATMAKRPGTISYGISSYGYDARVGYKFRVFSPIHSTEIDPKNFDPKMLEDVDLTPRHDFRADNPDALWGDCMYCERHESDEDVARYCDKSPKPNFIRIPPHSFALSETLEEFDIPRDVLCVVVGKSTYARCGLIVNVTPGEPEWVGKWTVEISNTTPLPARIYCGEGIMQVLFFRGDEVCRVSYKDKQGKYQNQVGVTLPSVDGAK